MKKLLSLLSVLTISGSTMSNVIANKPYLITAYENNLRYEILPPTSVKNLITTFMNKIETNDNFDYWIGTADYDTQWRFKELTENKTGNLYTKNMTAISDNVVQTFEDNYTNNSSSSQTFQTQSYSKTIGNTNSFTISLNESVSFNTSFDFLFFNSSINVDMNSSQTWDKTTTTEETVTAPSQSFIVSPNSKGTVEYIIRQGTYNSNGIIRYYEQLDFKFASPYWKTKGGKEVYSLINLVDMIKIIGTKYRDMLSMDYKGNCVWSVDNVDNPTVIIFSIPITWNSQGGKLDVTFDETPL
ncbi:ETX/MTX2 family pore-forming toxin [Spiroplasma endosymbiont of Phyllotreta cruciferae]|uniref:ETX/MTX2 family pore-forming toxin n=1 Tax=Spiroplasma endosymbiont of Phyllotreta cruciferae TaxID=2886375 RepID=UPI0020A2262A|nr:ETX/MTX2 family pore-forming toxin [Spiroplasma endosymbiont of Phyllotreta cruciferae]